MRIMPNYANNVGRSTPVGLYPSGNRPYGHSDLAGNARASCADWFDHDENNRALRGGSWHYISKALLSAFRLGDSPAS